MSSILPVVFWACKEHCRKDLIPQRKDDWFTVFCRRKSRHEDGETVLSKVGIKYRGDEKRREKRNLSENSKQLKKYIGNFITFGESPFRIRKAVEWVCRISHEHAINWFSVCSRKHMLRIVSSHSPCAIPPPTVQHGVCQRVSTWSKEKRKINECSG